MAPYEEPLRCLAVVAKLDDSGAIDSVELEGFLNDMAGPRQWLATAEWLFVEPPAEVAGALTVPVAVPEDIAVRAILNDLTNEPRRILFDHATSSSETRKWRWVAFQVAPNPEGKGIFPWERTDA